MAKRKTKKNVVSVNFKGVTTFKTPSEGDYLLRVTEVEKKTSAADNEMLSWEFQIAEGDFEGSKLFYNTVLNKDSLWKLREVLEALGQDVPDGKLSLDLKELVDCECGATVFHEIYEGKKKAKIADFLLADEVDGGSDEDEEDEEDESEGEDISSMDEDELEEFIEEHDLEDEVNLDDYSTIKKKRKAVQEAFDTEEEDEDEDEDEDDDDEVSYTEAQIKKMKLDQLEELNDDLDLGIDDIDEMKKPKAVRRVIKALKANDLFED